MTVTVKLRCEVAVWMRPAIYALALMARLGVPMNYEAMARRIVARGVTAAVERIA